MARRGETPRNLEVERSQPSIRLEFFRHDQKDTPSTAGDRSSDHLVRLTPQGRLGSTEAGKSKNPHPEVALAGGSRRERSVESGLRQMLSQEDRITPDMTLEDMREAIKEEVPVGRKDMVYSQLDFNWDGSQEFHDTGYQHALESKDSLVWLAEESDDIVVRNHDQLSTSYTRAAGNVAEIVQKYIGVLPRWQELTAEEPDKYANFSNELQRFLGSHQALVESFMLKVVEKVEGRDGVKELLKSFADKNGFAPSEGYSVVIRGEGESTEVAVRYKEREWVVDPKTIEEIIADRDSLNQRIDMSIANRGEERS